MIEFMLSIWLWIGLSVFFLISVITLTILIFLIFKRTHLSVELKAFISKTPIAIFFQDNRFAEWKPITPINGVVYDKNYGPFIVSTTYVDKKTKNIIIPFDVDMDGDRTANIKDVIDEFRHITNNEKSIALLRESISSQDMGGETENTEKLTSHIKFSSLKSLFNSSSPHNIKSKIEKIISDKVKRYGNVNPIHALITFGGIFGIIVIATILLRTMGIA